jgi:branched-chain amino acid transport system substrate-binding protein
MLLISAAAPVAMRAGEPGTVEFRDALRKSLEAGKEVVGTHAVYHYTAEDHEGVDQRSRILVVVTGGAYHYLPN